MEDYDIRYPDLNSNALFETWPMVSEKIVSWREPKFKRDYDLIDKNINHIITLFKRIQPKRVSLNQALRSFLVFFSVCFKSKSLTYVIIVINLKFSFYQDPLTDPVKTITSKDCHPHIIIIGSEINNVHYYIHVKSHLIPVKVY